jgi:hypothetical protein
MAVKERLDKTKCVETVWGKLIPETECYDFGVRHIAAFSSNIFQIMRILEPDFDKRTAAICEVAYGFNMAASSDQYMNGYYDEWNIPELCDRTAWLGAIWGDS